MTEIKKTLAILKARRPEVILLVGLNFLFLLSIKLMLTTEAESAKLQPAITSLFVLLMGTILTILTLGFQRTVYLEGEKQQSPMVLLKTGKRFFWRMVKLGLIWMPLYFILAWLTFSVTKLFTSINAGFFQTAQLFPLLYQFCFAVPSLILLKPLLLLPVIIIVWDCKVIESFKHLKNYRVFDAKELVILFLILTICNFVSTLLPNPDELKTILLLMVPHILIYFIRLMVVVTAVRFAASVNLVDDDKPAS